MDICIFKNKEEYEKYTNKNSLYVPRPSRYPCVLIKANSDPTVTWRSSGIEIIRNHVIEYLYLEDIQKELYNDDFNNLLKDNK